MHSRAKLLWMPLVFSSASLPPRWTKGPWPDIPRVAVIRTNHTSKNGDIALALAARTHIDLVITDNSMSGMSGIEMAKLLRTYPQHADVPVLMISSHQFEIGKGELAGTNIKHVEGKPFSIAAV